MMLSGQCYGFELLVVLDEWKNWRCRRGKKGCHDRILLPNQCEWAFSTIFLRSVGIFVGLKLLGILGIALGSG